MTEFTILLSDADTDLLYELKKKEGFNSLTGNQYAENLLSFALHRAAREYSRAAGPERISPPRIS